MKSMLSGELMYVKDLSICLSCKQDGDADDKETFNQRPHGTK